MPDTLNETAFPPGAWLPLCRLDELEPGWGKRIEVEGMPPLAVFLLDQDVFVTADTCSHGEASLCDGAVEGCEVECPWHAGKFDIRSGQATAFPAVEPIRIFKPSVREGTVGILLD